MAGSSLIGNLAVNLSLETAAFNRNASAAEKRAQTLGTKIGGIGKSMAGLGAAFAGGALIGGITSAVTGAFDMASALSEASEKLGLTVEGLQRLRTGANQTGISNDRLDAAIVRLNRSMGDLQLGKDTAVKAFEAIGLSAEDLKGKKPDEAMRIIADALNKIPDASERAAMGATIFGKGYASLIPLINGGSEALDKFAEQSKKNGEISTQDAQKLDDLADGWDMLKTRIGVATANIIAGVANMVTKIDGWLKNVQDSAAAFDAAIARMARNALTWVSDMVMGIGSAITGKLAAIWDGAKAGIESVRKAFWNLADKVQFRSYIPDMIAGIGEEFAKLREIMVDPALSATEKVGAAFQSLGRMVGGIFSYKAGGILSSLGQIANVLAPLFGGKGIDAAALSSGASAALNALPMSVPGFANGGGGVLGGRGGIDRNLLSLNGSAIARVSKGENIEVWPGGRSRSGSRVEIIPSPYFNVVVRGEAASVVGKAAPMIMAGGGNAGLVTQQRMAGRRLA